MTRSRRPRQRPRAALPQPAELTVTGHIHDGRGLAHYQGRAVFVTGALAGERVRARFSAGNARFFQARTLEVLDAAGERTKPVCRHFGQCGGCDLQHIGYERQVELKQRAVLDQLARAGAEPPVEVLPALVASPWQYRSRARLGVRFDKAGEVTLGFRRAADKQLINLKQCPVLEPVLEAMVAPLGQWLQAQQAQGVTHIELLADEDGPAAVLRHIRPLPERALAALAALQQTHRWRLWLSPEKNGPLYHVDGSAADPRLTLSLPEQGVSLAYHPSDFTQVNRALNRAMVAQALALLNPAAGEHVLDLFCGIGNFTLPLAMRAGRVSGVEAVATMVERGAENARNAGLSNISFHAWDLAGQSPRALLERVGAVDAALLDPPRAGARELCEAMDVLGPARVLYISCDPATLARDIGVLQKQGYRLQSLGIMDMFAQTAHVETMALLTRQ